jgi:hypothetical protein
MNSDGHLKKAQQMYDDILRLKEDDDEKRASSIVELSFLCAHHYCAYGCERRFQKHTDNHSQISKLLIGEGADDMAEVFIALESKRAGAAYGGKSNGGNIEEVSELLDIVIQWSL